MDGMREGERLTCQHVTIQDGEIQTLRQQLGQSTSERLRLIQRLTELEKRLLGVEDKAQASLEEGEALRRKVHSAIAEKQKVLRDLNQCQEAVEALKHTVTVKQRENQLKTTVFLKVMAEKGRLEARLSRPDQQGLAPSPPEGRQKHDEEAQLKAPTTPTALIHLASEAGRLKERLITEEAHLAKARSRLERYQMERGQLKRDLRQRNAEVAELLRDRQELVRRIRFVMAELAMARG